jgi:hypothetical protein
MNLPAFEISVAIVMVAVTVALFSWIRQSMARASEIRLKKMLQCAGLDPEIATQGDTETIVKEIRRRCRRCESEALCERWLAGEEKGKNVFCPNAQVFERLARTADSTR